MSNFTAASIRANPWNAVDEGIPEEMDLNLRFAAIQAASLCQSRAFDMWHLSERGELSSLPNSVEADHHSRYMQATLRLATFAKLCAIEAGFLPSLRYEPEGHLTNYSFSIDSIRENPWTAVDLDIPKNPSSYLLYVAFEAADYLQGSEFSVLGQILVGNYIPPEETMFNRGSPCRQAHDRFFRAARRASELSKLHARLFGESICVEAER